MSPNIKNQILKSDEISLKCAYKYRFYPTEEQIEWVKKSFGCSRFIYNHFSNIQIEKQEKKEKFLTNFEMDKILTSLKKEKAFLKEVNSQSLQSVTKDVKRAVNHYFENLKKGKRTKAFNFKSKNEDKQSFSFPSNNQVKFIHDYEIAQKAKFVYLSIPKLKTHLKVLKHRNWAGKICNVTISREIDDYYISIQCERVIKKQEINKEAINCVGIDKGVVKLATLHTGQYFEPINTYKEHQKELAKLQRQMAKKEDYKKKQKKAFEKNKKGNKALENTYFRPSNNYRKLQKRIKKLHRKIKRVRHEYLHLISSYLIKNHDYIMMEDLKTKNMTKSNKGSVEEPGKDVKQKSNLNKSILDQGWGILKTFTTYKSEWNNKVLTLVPPYNTSLECSSCHHLQTDNRVSQSKFVCTNCGKEMHADVNAGLNILMKGLQILRFSEEEIKGLLNPWAKGALANSIALSN